MNNLPSTIKYKDAFLNSPAAGFDGVFDWSWTDGCFGSGKITPMDFDGVVERNGNFILFETKNIGTPIPQGQMYTFKSAYDLECFTIVFIEGKTTPEFAKLWCQPGFKNGLVMDEHKPVKDMGMFKQVVSDWYQHAENNPRKKIDTSFLNKRIASLELIVNSTKMHLTNAVSALGGTVKW